MIRKLFFSLFLLNTFTLASQTSFGFKTGLNYDSMGDYTPENISITNITSQSKAGFHFGFFMDLDLILLYLRPELIYSKNLCSYNDVVIKLTKIELPIMLGYKVIGPISVFAGPSFQNFIKYESDNISIGKIKEKQTVSFQMGSRINIKNFGVSIRYERGFTDNEINIINGNKTLGHIHIRPKQFIFSFSYKRNFNN